MMKLRNWGGSAKSVLVPDAMVEKRSFGKLEEMNCLLPQWRMHPTVVEFGETDRALSKSGEMAYPLFIVRVKVERRYQFYVQRIALVLSLLSLASLTAYAVEVVDVASRLGVDFTLLLTLGVYMCILIYIPVH